MPEEEDDISKGLTTKEVIEKIRNISKKQIASDQKAAREKIAELEKELNKWPCKICGDSVAGVVKSAKKLIEDVEILTDMYKNNLYEVRVRGVPLTRDDVTAMVWSDESNIEKQFEMFEKCCKRNIADSRSKC